VKRGKKKKGTRRPLVLLIVVVVIVGGIFIWMNANGIRLGMRQVKSFKVDGVCLPTTDPKCGYCPGDVVDNSKCYVKYGELKEYE
jgi:hypothetical protein